jgi:hypothetical protein
VMSAEGRGELLVGEALLQDFVRRPMDQYVCDRRRPLEEPPRTEPRRRAHP